MKYLITVSYDGSKYYGFQRLNNLPSIQKELEDALSVINKDKVYVKGSGRTDRGVHALGQKCHFELKYDIPCERLINAINSLLSNYVRVLDCVKVNDDFHARFSVKKKIYKIIFKKEKDILTITFEGKSFYRYMVRNMVGALLLVGCGKISIEEFKNMIDSDENKYTYITAPSNGLYLESVEY